LCSHINLVSKEDAPYDWRMGMLFGCLTRGSERVIVKKNTVENRNKHVSGRDRRKRKRSRETALSKAPQPVLCSVSRTAIRRAASDKVLASPALNRAPISKQATFNAVARLAAAFCQTRDPASD
jgi:hypothetical protein